MARLARMLRPLFGEREYRFKRLSTKRSATNTASPSAMPYRHTDVGNSIILVQLGGLEPPTS